MARSQGVKEYRNFVKGYHTEATALTYPENASLDEVNYELLRTGDRKRRLGMQYEDGYTAIDSGYNMDNVESYAVSSHRWDNVNNAPDISIEVVQIGPKLWFFDLFKNTISDNILNSGNPITISGFNGINRIETAETDGYLVITCGETDPIYLEYDSTTDTVSQTDIILKIRDFFGVADSLETAERPTTLTDTHKYNLYNQGWSTYNTSNSQYEENKITDFDTARGEYPSNADQVITGNYVNSTTGQDAWSASQFDNDFDAVGTSPAPKGRMVIKAFARGADRLAVTDITSGLATDNEQGRPATVTAHSSRLFYAGIRGNISGADDLSPDYNGFIFFTRIIRNKNDFGTCYQEADPTAEFINELVATDGGYVHIPEAYNIRKLVSVQDSLIVMADNGVWEVHGGDLGFSANEYIVTKTTDLGCISAGSVIDVEDGVVYWSKGGIYTLSPERISGRFAPQNITETTIQSYYNDISNAAKENCIGNFDPPTRKISWLFNTDSAYDGLSYRHKYNAELHLDTVLSAFYKYEINDTSDYIAGYTQTPEFLTIGNTTNVKVDGVQVTVDSVDVTVDTVTRVGSPSTTKYLALVYNTGNATYDFSFAHYWESNWADWGTYDAAAYLVTGHETYGDTFREKQVPYLFVHLARTETGFDSNLDAVGESSCMVQAQWNWANSVNSGRWSTPFQAYRLTRSYFPTDQNDTFDYGFSVITTKSKLRGKGKALSLKFYTEAGKDCHILGWATPVSGGTVP